MVSHLFYYQLALLALVWLFVMLHVAASHPGAPIPPTATPLKPKRKRANAPKPFHGLTHKPVVSLNFRDEVLSAESHKIRGSQRTQVP